MRLSHRLLAKSAPALATVLTVAGWPTLGPGADAAGVPLSIAVSGNHFVDGSGRTVRLLGVNTPSLEYACVDGYGYDDGHQDDATAAAIASWHATAVRVPLNEDCWLGINGQPNSNQGADPELTVSGYRAEVTAYVNDLNAHGLYAILDLHWSAPGAVVADGQRSMPDADHSAAFWSSVAGQFKGNSAVVFDAFNEPFSPVSVSPTHPVSWDCWRDGGCSVPSTADGEPADGSYYTAAGMQTLVTAIRNAGARQPILLGGLDYANDLTGWLAHRPSDPLGQLAASFHNYQGKPCDDAACWGSTIASVAASVPVVTGEFDQGVCATSSFDEDYMSWADRAGVGYLAWGWWVLTQPEIQSAGCSAFYLITDHAGTPAAPNGTALHSHLAALAVARPPATLTSLSARLKGKTVRLTLSSTEDVQATVSAQTKKTVGHGHHRKHLSLGTAVVHLTSGSPGVVTLKASRKVLALLTGHRSLKLTITVDLGSGVTARTVKVRRH